MRTYRNYQMAALLAVLVAAFLVVGRVPAQNSGAEAGRTSASARAQSATQSPDAR